MLRLAAHPASSVGAAADRVDWAASLDQFIALELTILSYAAADIAANTQTGAARPSRAHFPRQAASGARAISWYTRLPLCRGGAHLTGWAARTVATGGLGAAGVAADHCPFAAIAAALAIDTGLIGVAAEVGRGIGRLGFLSFLPLLALDRIRAADRAIGPGAADLIGRIGNTAPQDFNEAVGAAGVATERLAGTVAAAGLLGWALVAARATVIDISEQVLAACRLGQAVLPSVLAAATVILAAQPVAATARAALLALSVVALAGSLHFVLRTEATEDADRYERPERPASGGRGEVAGESIEAVGIHRGLPGSGEYFPCDDRSETAASPMIPEASWPSSPAQAP